MQITWRPISEAPAKPAKFWCRRKGENDDTLMLVERAEGPGYRLKGAETAVCVINYRVGKFWWPDEFVSLDDLPVSGVG